MKQTDRPIWKRSMLQTLNLDTIREELFAMSENGDPYGYDSDEEGYYQEYKELFDEISVGAWNLFEAMNERSDLREYWDDATVALLGETQEVLGYDMVENDYHGLLSIEQEMAQVAAAERLLRLTKKDLLALFRYVLAVIVSYADIRAAHDCLTSIVTELDERAAIMQQTVDRIDKLYVDLTGHTDTDLDRLKLPGRMWVE